jgi:hypothetical protein
MEFLIPNLKGRSEWPPFSFASIPPSPAFLASGFLDAMTT